jgi:hypothetical protein
VMYTWLPPCVHRNTVGTLPSFAGAALHCIACTHEAAVSWPSYRGFGSK